MSAGWFRWAALIAAAPGFLLAAPLEIKVEVTEVDHSKASRLGIEWLNSAAFAEASPAGLVAIGSVGRLTPLRADLHFLVEEGAAELLANPNLITDSGTAASFQAGGEIPYITSASLGATHVEFKPYGVALNVRPTLLKSGLIRMRVTASVSAPDPTNGVLLSGNAVPALLERKVTSQVTLEPGSTMTLAGLVQSQKDQVVRGVPVLRHLPLLGSLFRWQSRRVRRTSIVIFVTPRLVES